jgi:hypothetical protein
MLVLHSRLKFLVITRKGEAFPHIGRQSRTLK